MNLGVEARKLPANIEVVLDKLRWMRQQRIWPNGLRYLWTDAFGLVLLVSLHRHLVRTYKFDLFSRGFVQLLAAQQTPRGDAWFQGTADAVHVRIWRSSSSRAASSC